MKETLLLTLSIPSSTSSFPLMLNAMLAFQKGRSQQVLSVLKENFPDFLPSVSEHEHEPIFLCEMLGTFLSERMGEPVEAFPVETVGYFSIEASP